MKLLNKAGEMPSKEASDDQRTGTLYVGGVDGKISEQKSSYYPCMDPQRMGAVKPSQEGSSRGLNVNKSGSGK